MDTDKNKIVTPDELKQQIENTSFEEAIEIYKESNRRDFISHYDEDFQPEVVKKYSKFNFYKPYFWLLEYVLFGGDGVRSAALESEDSRKATLLLLSLMGPNRMVVEDGSEKGEVAFDFLDRECYDHGIVTNSDLNPLIEMVIESYVPSLVNTKGYKLFKNGKLGNLIITIPKIE